MNIKQIGGILMITGNAIGGGMLALPLATAQAGFINSTLFLILCWIIMLAGSLLILEVNLWFPEGSHLVSMSRTTLGRTGAIVTWLCYLLLLYSLLAAYIAGGADFLQGLFQKINLHFPPKSMAILFVIALGSIVWKGIRSVDTFNRVLMGSKLLIYILLITLIFPFLLPKQLCQGHFYHLPSSLSIMITSFGFAAIVPSLRGYFNSDVQQLRRVIILGSLIPLICYILWNAAIIGIIPLYGNSGLVHIMQTKQPTSALTNTLSTLLDKNLITGLAWGFTSICLATSFLGVALSLTDFLKDGFALQKRKKNKKITTLFTFIPPLIVVLFFPGAFMTALNYAGIWCAGLLALIPALMAWSGRYAKQLTGPYQVRGGKFLLSFVMLAATITIVNAILVDVL